MTNYNELKSKFDTIANTIIITEELQNKAFDLKLEIVENIENMNNNSIEMINTYMLPILENILNAESIKEETKETFESPEKYNGAEYDKLTNKYTSEFQNEYNKMVNNLRASGLDEGSVYITKKVNNIYSFEINGYNRTQKLTWDFDNNCKADFRKKEYKSLIK